MNKRKLAEKIAETARKKLLIVSDRCKAIATVAKEQRKDIFRTKQDCLRLVDEAKQEANITIQSVLKASADSEAKSQRLITSIQKQSETKIALITHWANKKIESSKMDLEHAQQDCQSKSMAALEADRSIIRMTCAHTHELLSLTSKHKSALRDTQARHLLRFEEQKQSMTNEIVQEQCWPWMNGSRLTAGAIFSKGVKVIFQSNTFF